MFLIKKRDLEFIKPEIKHRREVKRITMVITQENPGMATVGRSEQEGAGLQDLLLQGSKGNTSVSRYS